jgi:hypothetical protein
MFRYMWCTSLQKVCSNNSLRMCGAWQLHGAVRVFGLGGSSLESHGLENASVASRGTAWLLGSACSCVAVCFERLPQKRYADSSSAHLGIHCDPGLLCAVKWNCSELRSRYPKLIYPSNSLRVFAAPASSWVCIPTDPCFQEGSYLHPSQTGGVPIMRFNASFGCGVGKCMPRGGAATRRGHLRILATGTLAGGGGETGAWCVPPAIMLFLGSFPPSLFFQEVFVLERVVAFGRCIDLLSRFRSRGRRLSRGPPVPRGGKGFGLREKGVSETPFPTPEASYSQPQRARAFSILRGGRGAFVPWAGAVLQRFGGGG